MAEKIKVNLLSDTGTRVIELDFPSDEQWTRRLRARKIQTKELGRGESRQTIIGDEIDATLLQEISGETLDEADATTIMNNLGRVDVEDVEREGSKFKVTLRVVGGRMIECEIDRPSSLHLKRFRNAYAHSVNLPHNKSEVRTNPAVAAELFDEIAKQHAEIPIIYKIAALGAVIQEIDRILEPSAESF